MKTNQQVQPRIEVDAKGNVIAVHFEVRGKPTLTMRMDLVSDVNKAYAAGVGFAQVRIVDAAAVKRNKKDGSLKSDAEMLDEKYENMADLIAHYETGTTEWSRVAASSGPKGGYLFEALCEYFTGQKSAEEIRAYLDTLSNKEQNALRDDDEIAPIIQRIKAAKLAKVPESARIDTKSLLGKIGG